MKRSKDYLFRTCCSERITHHHLCLEETLRQQVSIEVLEWKKRGVLTFALVGGCWHGDVGDGLIRSKTSDVFGEGSISGVLWLVLS